MRAEFALIAAILTFCCWCTYIILNLNSNLTLTSTTSFPTNRSYDYPSKSLYPESPRSPSQGNQIYNRYTQSTSGGQPNQNQHQQHQASNSMPLWQSVVNSQDVLNNRVSLGRYFKHPEARQNEFAISNNFDPSNRFNIYREDYHSSVPTYPVSYNQHQSQLPILGIIHKVVGGTSLKFPKETDSAAADSNPDSARKLEPDLEPKSHSLIESDPSSDDGQENHEEVELISGSEPNAGTDEAEYEQQQQLVSEGQIHRRSSSPDQIETKAGLSKEYNAGKILNHPPTWSKQSNGRQTEINPNFVVPEGPSEGLIKYKSLVNADQRAQSQSLDQKKHITNSVMRLEKGAVGHGGGRRSRIDPTRKLRSNVTENSVWPASQQYSTGRKLTKLMYPVRQEGVSKVNKSPYKETHKHRLRESLSAQHWDDDVSGQPERRTQKPESHVGGSKADAEAEIHPHSSSKEEEEEEEEGDPG